MTNFKFFITCTDNFLSGWGQAEGRKNKLVFEADSYEVADFVAKRLKERGDMSYVRIGRTFPKVDVRSVLLQTKTPDEFPSVYPPEYVEVFRQAMTSKGGAE